MLYSIITKTGWTMHYVMWKVSWLNIRMMIADAPGTRKKSEEKEVSGKELAGIIKRRKRWMS